MASPLRFVGTMVWLSACSRTEDAKRDAPIGSVVAEVTLSSSAVKASPTSPVCAALFVAATKLKLSGGESYKTACVMDSWSVEAVDCFLRAGSSADWQGCRNALLSANLDRLVYREHLDRAEPLGWSCRGLLDYVTTKLECATLTPLQQFTLLEMQEAAEAAILDLTKPKPGVDSAATELRCISVQRLAIEAVGDACP